MNVIANLQEFVGENLTLLAEVKQAWQPTDFLPDFSAADWREQLEAFRSAADELPDDLLVVLVGNTITEEALPNYAVSLARLVNDPSGVGETPWAHWLRGWTAEENRHGDLLNTYLRISGRVDMRSIERTIHNLIRSGFTTGHHDNDYAGLIYTAFQERATRITHANVAKLAECRGDENLSKICRKIAIDETRHEAFYTRVIGEVMKNDPEEGVLAYRSILKGLVSMPGRSMRDDVDPGLFGHYAAITQRTGVYTTLDYAGIIRHLNRVWDIPNLSVSGKAAKAQEYLCKQPERYELLASEIAAMAESRPTTSFSWLHGRKA
ncbi:acyl-ACP desaturase [Isosphaeraceae bacterium EP7]